MEKRELLQQMQNLQDQLANAKDLDSGTVDSLGQLVGSMNELVQHKEQGTHSAEEFDAIRQGLLDRVEQFESDHPVVTRFLAQMTDFLGMMGI